MHGVGAETAAQLLITAGDNPARIGSDAQFAALTGVAPIPASSGKTTRHRLSRGGDRAANAAIHRTVLVRMGSDQRTHDYVSRRRAEGLSTKEIMRCLKRFVAREIYRHLTNRAPAPPVHDLRPARRAANHTLASAARHLETGPSQLSSGIPLRRLVERARVGSLDLAGELTHVGRVIAYGPVLDTFAVDDPDHVHLLVREPASGWRHSEVFADMAPTVRAMDRDGVGLGENSVNRPSLVSEGPREHVHEVGDAAQTRRGPGRSFMVDEVLADHLSKCRFVICRKDLFQHAPGGRRDVSAAHFSS